MKNPNALPSSKGTPIAAILGVSVLVAIQSVIQAVNAAVLVFSGPLQDFIGAALVASLASAVVMLAVGATTGAFRGAVLAPHSAFAIGMLVPISAIVADAPDDNPVDRLAATAFICLAFASAFAGLLCLAISRARASGLARYLPTSVIAGLMASVALQIIIGGVQTAMGRGLNEFVIFEVFKGAASREVLIASLAFGAAQIALMRAWRNPVALAILPVVGLVAAVPALAWLGWDHVNPAASAWFLPVAAEASWPPLSAAIGQGWPVGLDFWELASSLAFVVPAVIITAMVYVASIETAIKRDLDFDDEIRRVGLGMCATAFAGGFAGFHSASATVLTWRRALGDPRATLIAAALVAVLAFFGNRYLPALPVPVVAGLLFAIGVGLLIEWLREVRLVHGTLERVIAWGMIALTLTVGLVPTLGLGLLAVSLQFVLSYRRIPVIRSSLSLAELRSNVERPEPDDEALAVSGKDVRILRLQGYLFFATAHGVYEGIRRDIAIYRPRHLILDFGSVSGADTSAAKALEKVLRATSSDKIHTHFAQMPSAIAAALAPSIVGIACENHATLDEALERVEDTLIAEAPPVNALAPLRELVGITRGADRREFADGEILARVGEAADTLILILAGRIEAFVHLPGRKPLRLRAMLAGTILGEIGFFTSGVRTANLRARGPTTVLILTRGSYERLQKTDPDVAAEIQTEVIRKLSRRLLDRDRLVRTLLT